MRARFFVLLFAVLLVCYISFHGLVWTLWVEDLASRKYAGGDLARMGYVYGSRMPRQSGVTLPVRHLELREYDGRPIDVLTIGDSFSNSVALGENGLYQDYIALFSNCTVLNIPPLTVDRGATAPGLTLLKLHNSGYLDRLAPRHVVLQSVERSAIQRFGRPIDFDVTASTDEIDKLCRTANSKADAANEMHFINGGNFKFVVNNLYYYPLKGRNLDKRIYTSRLDRPFFTVQRPDQLVHFHEDLKNVPLATPESVRLLNDNLNRIADMLAKKGIQFYFMPVVDKTNLYGDYIVRNHHPRSRFFEVLRPLPRRYTLIDTKAILAEELRKGVKDVYYADDTHWSWKASEAIFKVVTFR